ncbi:Sorting nexin-1, partial [Acipenser ruthenus]
VGDGMNAYMAYKVSTQTNLPMFKCKTYTVKRRFSDFLGLYEKLSEKHSQNGYIVPPPPEKSILGMTKVKVGKEDSSSVEFVERRRASLESNTAMFAKSVAMLGSSEDNTALSRALSQLAEVEDKIEQLHQDQACNDFFILAELFADYIRLLTAVRGSFDHRMKTWQRWQDAQTTLQKKRENEAKLLWANKPDKLQQAKDEISEVSDGKKILLCTGGGGKTFQHMPVDVIIMRQNWHEKKLVWESKVTQYERDFERVSATVRKEVLRFELPRAVSTQALSGAGFLKMINRATDAVSKMTIKMNESDIVKLSSNTAMFAKSVAMLGSSEDNTALSRALSQLAEVEDKIEQLHQDQACNDFFILAELFADYIRLLTAVRGSFDHRMKTWQRWQDAQTTLQKKRENEAKLLWANKPDKLQQAKDEISEVSDGKKILLCTGGGGKTFQHMPVDVIIMRQNWHEKKLVVQQLYSN